MYKRASRVFFERCIVKRRLYRAKLAVSITLGFTALLTMPIGLVELKRLRRERGETSPFQNHTAFLKWADEVEAHLHFHPAFLQSFKHSVHAAKMVHGSRLDNTRGVNEAIGTVNKAITLLETQEAADLEAKKLSPVATAISYPPKLTLKWLYEHAPWSFYVWLFGALSASFGVGFAISTATTKIISRPFSSAAPMTTDPTTARLATSPHPSPTVIETPKK